MSGVDSPTSANPRCTPGHAVQDPDTSLEGVCAQRVHRAGTAHKSKEAFP